jgi:hypothetical protein
MSSDNVVDAERAMVVNRLRTHPVTYTVEISHFVVGGEWQMGVSVHGTYRDSENRRRVAADLREAADRIENWEVADAPPPKPQLDVWVDKGIPPRSKLSVRLVDKDGTR